MADTIVSGTIASNSVQVRLLSRALSVMNALSIWIKNARSSSLVQSIMPSVLAVTVALGSEGFSLLEALIAVVGVICAHLSLNLADDYFDYRYDILPDREKVVRKGFRAVMVKYPYLTDGSQTPKTLLRAIIGFGSFALFCGLIVFIIRTLTEGFFGNGGGGSWIILAIAALTGFLGIFYSAPPLKLAFRGFGELIIGVIFGPLLMLGVYYSASGTITPEILWISIPVGLWVLNILYTHSFLERAGDAESGKKTLALLLKTNNANMLMAIAINALPFLMILSAVCLGFIHPAYLAIFLLAPPSLWLCRSLYKFNQGQTGVPDKAPSFLGPMGKNWSEVKKHNMDWFLMRWIAARNILGGFCAIITIVKLILVIF